MTGTGGAFSASPTSDEERIYFGQSGRNSRGPLIAVNAGASGDLSLDSLGPRGVAWVQDTLPGRGEQVTQGLALGRDTTRIRMRWRDDITSDMRITVHKDSDQIYQIISGPIDVDGRKSMIEVICEKYSS